MAVDRSNWSEADYEAARKAARELLLPKDKPVQVEKKKR
jgi:hypothetical protein